MAARDLYEVVIRDYTADSARADALYRLGLLQVDPRSAIRDFRAANATFARLLREHPSSRWDAEARAWQATLAALLERDEEIRRAMQRVRDSEEDTRRATQRQQRSEEERKRTKQKLEWLKESDVDLQRRR